MFIQGISDWHLGVPMKIAFFTDCFVPQVNGIVTSLFDLAKGLSDSGHQVFIVAPRYYRRYREFEYPNVRVLRMPSMPALFYDDYRITLPFDIKIFNILRKEGIDIVHFEAPFTVALAGIAIAKMLRKPIVGTFHTFIVDPHYLKHGFPTSKGFQKFGWEYCKFYYNKCDLVTTPSNFTRKELIRHGLKKEIAIISNGIDISMFDNSAAEEFGAQHGLTGPILFFVGRMAHEKNIEYLIDSMVPVFKSYPSSKLLLIGDGPQFAEVKGFIENRDLSGNILMLGRMEHSDLVKSGIFGIADIFVTASETENQPMSILEAMANGIPCVGLSEKGIPDLIIDEVNGLVVPNNDKDAFSRAIMAILGNDDLKKSLSLGARREMKRHSSSEVLNSWERTYREVRGYRSRGSRMARIPGTIGESARGSDASSSICPKFGSGT